MKPSEARVLKPGEHLFSIGGDSDAEVLEWVVKEVGEARMYLDSVPPGLHGEPCSGWLPVSLYSDVALGLYWPTAAEAVSAAISRARADLDGAKADEERARRRLAARVRLASGKGPSASPATSPDDSNRPDGCSHGRPPSEQPVGVQDVLDLHSMADESMRRADASARARVHGVDLQDLLARVRDLERLARSARYDVVPVDDAAYDRVLSRAGVDVALPARFEHAFVEGDGDYCAHQVGPTPCGGARSDHPHPDGRRP